MDNQRQQYIPGPPPPPGQGTMGHLPPPPPRPYPGSNLPPPPPGPHPNSMPLGTVFGLPGAGWQQPWGRSGLGQNIPPPPPLNHNQSQGQHVSYGMRQLNIPPPPPQNDKPILSATFIPTGDSFGPGVGIPPLDDYASWARYDAQFTSEPSLSHADQKYADGSTSHSYSYPNPAQPNPDIANRESRAASASSNKPSFTLPLRDISEPISPGPPTATLINPQTNVDGRQRAQSAAITGSNSSELSAQWPLDRVLIWLAANGFSNDWQETFRALKLQGSDFLDLGRGPNGRGNLGMMHQTIYPQLAKVCSNSNTGWDQGREREEGKRLRKLISRLVEQGGEGPASAGIGHRRRESNLISSANTDTTLENSPHLGRSEFGSTPGTAGPEGSPGKQMPPPFPAVLGHRTSQPRSSTMPVLSKHSSASSTPSDPKPPDNFAGPGRADYTRGALNNLNNRGRHSPNISGDGSTGLLPKAFEASPNASPGLGTAVPVSATSTSSQSQRPDHSKNNSTDSMLHASNHPRSNTVESSSRYYADRRNAQEDVRPSPLEAHKTWSTSDYGPGPGGKDQSKGFLSKFMRKRHEHSQPPADDHPSDQSPTSPGPLKIFSRPSANGSDSALLQRPSSTVSEDGRVLVTGRRGSNVVRRYIFVTPDFWNYRLVDVTEVETAIALRSLICIELGIPDAEYAQIFLTEPGQSDHESALSDNALVAIRSRTDTLGSVKLYVRSPTLSAVPGSTSRSNGLGVSFGHKIPVERGAPMVKSNSSGGLNRNDYPSPGADALLNGSALMQKQAEEHRRKTEAQQKAYLESRRAQKDQSATYSGSTIRGNTVIDFDSPRHSPFEEKKVDSLVPVRRPPTAPAESTTLTKVNSLRARGSGSRSSLDALKRISDPIAEEDGKLIKKKSATFAPLPSSGIGAALANMGKMGVAPAALASQGVQQDRSRADYGRNNSGGSLRRDYTRGKGDMMFKVPDYEEGYGESHPENRPRNAVVENARRFGPSPAVSPSTEAPPRPFLQSRKSYGPDLEFKETNVSFAPSPHPQKDDDSDDDSDDGLFAIPLANKSMSSTETGTLPRKSDQRPALTVDTDQNTAKNVRFKSPSSSSGVQRTGSESATASGEGYDRNYSDGSFSGSAQSPDDRMSRRDSFISDIWANRPAVENVVDHLDEFFPGVDLDKPYLEEKGENNSPMKSSDQDTQDPLDALEGPSKGVTFGTVGLDLDFSRKNDSDTLGSDESTLKAKDRGMVASVAKRQVGKAGGLGRMKSIREVAQKRNDIGIRRGPSIVARVPETSASSIVRRKSTKMFGAHIVQIRPKPGTRLSTLDPIPQEDVPTDDTPKRQATFKIIRGQLIGKGTYGRVYLGMNATTGDFLAVKQVEVNQKAAGQDKDRIKEMVAALDQEIDTMQHLEHPNIVQYLGCERKEFSISIYLEYIAGGSIGSCIRKHGKFEESVVRSLTRQTLEGLAYLHQEGILHRDLKADNILLDLDGSCKISDFGISKKSDNIYGNDITNSMQGSVFWMAPEVVRSQGQGYSAKVDIWSLGCVVLEMFAGKRPWSREEAIGAIFKLGSLSQAPPIPEDVQSTATVDGLNFMYDCFQVNATDRPTADTLLRHSTFCIPDPYYNFYDTTLAAKLRNVGEVGLGG
ncbi:mitogen-activated protein kinase kinase kinase [Cladophialophora chaetospira]|uniref:Mitogen-activated protein kinase kinae kinase bck1 n=1 Tax=Cladophialophora chaetospira TaxID=386627 RepID=A0AA38WZL4_9EURO|nr:mitogen-activated protein kinase kinase kinase [Cladophialophora chaetospira]